ncbi:trap dicarboxylate family transporter, dctq subunit [Oceaniovalibus guishaninsula JLT2003]|uniref:TRAP transporter small permease protein n=1 Tax=Oceaniovalibus guishaninsula JLT2003 TaxID=1231392 RepID=K2GQC5_9RHOB|nr:TRAP transporter small permease [Oceaniovalibus guishaninsula]EKE44871.1 trap dicarboxylate family transporter, dctq subunit [Oceaniovalibus guishaninsula JLT2003]
MRGREDIDVAATSEALPHTALSEVPPESGVFGRAVDALGIVFACFFLISTAIILYEIVARYVFNSPTNWVHETTTFLCGVSFIFGGLYALSRDKHIRVVLIYDAVPPAGRRWLNVALSVVGLVTMVFFAIASWQNTSNAIFTPQGDFRLETSGSAWNPAYPGMVKLFLFIVIVAMAAQFVVLIVNYARGKGG